MPDLTTLFQGNNWLLIVLALFLFKDQIFTIFQPKPQPTPSPTPAPVPAPSPVTPPDRPIVDLLIQVLPVLIPLVIDQLKKQEPPK